MKRYQTGVLLLAAGLALAACGASDNTTSAGSHAATADDGYYGTATPSTTATADASIKTAPSALGTILVDDHGRTLYGFTADADGRPTCDGACAKAWPPITTTGGATVGAAGPAASLVTTVRRSDGTSQVKVGKWPVYLFAGDAAPGDVNGEGSGGTWFALAVDGTLVKQAPVPGSTAPMAPSAPTTPTRTPTTTSAPAPARTAPTTAAPTPTPPPPAPTPKTSAPAPAPAPQPPASEPVGDGGPGYVYGQGSGG